MSNLVEALRLIGDVDGWRQEAMTLRKLREEETAAMNALSDLVEKFIKGEESLPLVLLAFHHVAMRHGASARKHTLKQAMKSSIEVLSEKAPAIFPPDRVPLSRSKNRK